MHLIDLEMKMHNQRDLETAYGKATVSLLSRDAGLALLPNVPPDIAERTARMCAGHNELLAEKHRGK